MENQNQKKYVSLDGLGTFLDNLNANFAPLTHNHTTSDITDYQVDDTFSDTSTNSVQNKVLTAKFNDVEDDIQTLSDTIESKRLVTEEKINIIGGKGLKATVGLSFVSNNDGTCRVVGFNDEYDDNIVNIVIPCISPNGDIVTSIEESAFEGCDSLENMLLPDSVTSIGDWAFYECYSLASVTIGNGVTSIGQGAFASCSSLTSVTIPDSVTSIGSSVFANCTELTNVLIGNNVTSISNSAFYYCYNLTNINISDKVTSIGDSAFNGCESLTDITIGNGVTSIGNAAFQGCENLTSIIIPKNVTTIDSIPFDGCSNLTAIYCEVESQPDDDWSGEWNEGVDCPIYWGVKYDVPASFNKHEVDNEGNAWFAGDVYVGGNSQDVESKRLVTEEKINIIGGKGLKATVGLSFVSNNDGTCRVVGFNDEYDDNIVNIVIPCISPNGDIVTSIEESAFKSSRLTSVTIPDSVTTIGRYAFQFCSSLASVTIGNGVTSIGDSAFDGCSELTNVKIPNTVTSIGSSVFSSCSSLTSVTIGNSVTSIGTYAFQNCTNLTSVTIPNSVTFIGDRAFQGCESLTDITIPNSVMYMGEEIFDNCLNFTAIYCEAKSQPNDDDNNIGWNEQWNNINCPIYWGVKYITNLSELTEDTDHRTVTDDEKATWNAKSDFSGNYNDLYNIPEIFDINGVIPISKGGTGASTAEEARISLGIANATITTQTVEKVNYYLQDISTGLAFVSNGDGTCYVSGIGDCTDTDIVIPSVSPDGDSVEAIGDYAFFNCNLASVTIGNSVEAIGDYAFSGCNLASVTIGNSVEAIGEYAFFNCSRLTSVTIGNGVTSIGDFAFSDCSSLTSVTIGNGVTSIGVAAFHRCTSLTSVTIGNSVTSIGSNAFQDCTSLTSVTIPNSVTSIGAYAFYGCTSLINATIGKSVTSIGNYAFYDCTSLKDLTIPHSVTSIGNYAFFNCSSLTSITIGNGVTSIGDWAFYYCSNLTSVTIPDSVTSIGDSAFRFCYNLTSVTIPDSVTSIGEYAFDYCTSLTSVTIPDSVETIGSSAFATSPCLRKIYCEASSKPDDWQENWNENNDSVVVWGISLNDINDEKIARINLDLDTAHSAMSGYDIDNGTVEERLYQLSQNQTLPNAAMSGYDTTKGTIEERLNKLGFSESSVSSLAYKGDGATLTVNKIQKQGNMVFGELKIDYSQCTAIVSCSDGKGAVNYTQNNVPFTVTSTFPSGYAPQSTNKSFIVPCMINDSTNKPIQGHCTATFTISRSLEVTNFMINDTKPNKVNIREIDILFWYDITK